MRTRTLDLRIILFRMSHEQSSSFTVKRVVGIWVTEELRKEHFKDVYHIYTAISVFEINTSSCVLG